MAEYIDREAVMKTAKNGNHSDFGRSMADLTSLREVLEDTPAVDMTEVVHGEWKFNKDGSGTCNQCGITQKNVWDYDGWQNYCGHCGADMRGTEKRSTDV